MRRIFTDKVDFKKLSHMCDYTVAQLHRFPEGSAAALAAPLAIAAITKLKDAAAAHASLGNRIRELIREKEEARKDLRREVESVYHTADGIAGSVLDFNVHFRLPLHGDSKLLVAARSAIEKAAPYADLFIQHAKPADFLNILKQKLRRFEQAIEDSINARNAHAMGPRVLQDSLDQALGTWRGFDAIVRNTFSDDRLALEAWTLVCKLPRNSRSKPEPSAETTPTSAETSEAVA